MSDEDIMRHKRFEIKWKYAEYSRDGEWWVSIPNYGGGEVVKAEEYDRLEAENAELRKDRARLDWLDFASAPTESTGKPIEYFTGISWTERGSMRAAIDAAMESEKPVVAIAPKTL